MYGRAQIPGFRLGKVPRSVIEQKLQKEIIEELSNRAAHRMGREALSEAGVEALGPVEIGDIECVKGKPFRFTGRFWPMPEMVLPELGSLVIRDDSTDPKDQISNQLLERVIFRVPDDVVHAELGNDEGDNVALKAAADRVRLILILKRIARQEGIEVSEADIDQRIKEKAVEFGSDPNVLRSELEEGGGRQRLKDMLLSESTLEYIVEKSTQTKGEQS